MYFIRNSNLFWSCEVEKKWILWTYGPNKFGTLVLGFGVRNARHATYVRILRYIQTRVPTFVRFTVHFFLSFFYIFLLHCFPRLFLLVASAFLYLVRPLTCRPRIKVHFKLYSRIFRNVTENECNGNGLKCVLNCAKFFLPSFFSNEMNYVTRDLLQWKSTFLNSTRENEGNNKYHCFLFGCIGW